MLLDSQLGEESWTERVNTAVYLHFRSPSSANKCLTPYEKLYKKRPELSHLHRFGCLAYKLIPDAQRHGKFVERAKKCGFLGYVHGTSKIWRLWDTEGKRVIQASDVCFNETQVVGNRVTTSRELEVLRFCVPDNMTLDDDEPEPAVLQTAHPMMTESPNRLFTSSIGGSEENTSSCQQSPRSPINAISDLEKCSEPTDTSCIVASEDLQVPVLQRLERLSHSMQAQLAYGRWEASVTAKSDLLSYREALSQSRSAK